MLEDCDIMVYQEELGEWGRGATGEGFCGCTGVGVLSHNPRRCMWRKGVQVPSAPSPVI